MRLAALAALALLAATPAFAEEKVWTAAPTPGVAVSGTVSPADRAGNSNGPDNASPFSGVPSGTLSNSGGPGTVSTARELADSATPSLSR